MIRLGLALRDSFASGYSLRQLRGDLLAGISVGIVALPLSMALAMAVGLPPQHGLYTAIVAGLVAALTGGSRFQVTGPTAAFVAILLPIVHAHGPVGLMLATTIAGAFLVLLGFLRLGKYLELVPYPVVTGFTAGIGITIATGQLAGASGMEGVVARAHWHEVVWELAACAPTIDAAELGIGLLTMVVLLMAPKLSARLPGPLLAMSLATLVAWFLQRQGFADITTIADKFSYQLPDGTVAHGIPPWPPTFAWPWTNSDGSTLALDFAACKELLLAGLTICMLGAIESLLSAVVADGMSNTRHDPDAELIGQGLGNLAAPFFGGFAATGAIARTATSIRSGAKSPIAAVVHSLFLLGTLLGLAPLLGMMPIAALSALLLKVAWRIADFGHVARVLRKAPRADKGVLLLCMGLTVVFDMVVGVVAGMTLASLLFLRRMARLTGVRLLRPEQHEVGVPIPPNVLVYAIEGPLFFGAAERAMSTLQAIGQRGGVVVLDMEGVQTIDATGVVNLESVLGKLRDDQVKVVLTGLDEHVESTLLASDIKPDGVWLVAAASLREGVQAAATLVAAN